MFKHPRLVLRSLRLKCATFQPQAARLHEKVHLRPYKRRKTITQVTITSWHIYFGYFLLFKKKTSYTMAVQGLLGRGSVMVGRMRAFVVANEMCRVRVSVGAAASASGFSIM